MTTDVIEWLLDSDPSIRWQVMRDLIGEPDATVQRERSRVAAKGWGARLLDLQGSDGHWGGAAFVPHAWISTMDTLQLLRDLGVDPASDRMRRAISLVRQRGTWGGEFADSPFFEGRVDAVFVPDALALRPPVGARLPAQSGGAPDPRIAEAVDLVAGKRDDTGRWPLENTHPGPVHFEMEGRAGEPSRWNTLRSLRVLRWAQA
jgi:hypothetical protein